MLLATVPQEGETPFRAQRRIVKARMIVEHAVYDEAPAWYYKIPSARSSIKRKLATRHKLSKRGFSNGDVDFVKILSTGQVKAKLSSQTQRHSIEASSSDAKAKPKLLSNKRMRDKIVTRVKENSFPQHNLMRCYKGSSGLKRKNKPISFLDDSSFYYIKTSTISKMGRVMQRRH